MNKTKKFEDLTKEQQVALKGAGTRLVSKMFLNGVNCGALIMVSGIVLYFLNELYVHSTPFFFVSSITTDIILLKMMGRSNREAAKSFNEKAKKILEAK